MKATELRIGNWVKTCVPDMEAMIPYLDTQVQGIDIFGRPIFCHTPQREGFSMSPNHITGIPLTPEILEMAGFNWDTVTFWKNGCGIMLAPKEKGYSVFYNWLSHGTIAEIEYVHQLQNLFFALTGTELEINLNKEK